MPRPERPIDPSWPLADFASGLRELRRKADLTYKQLSRRAHYEPGTLSEAAGGRKLPSVDVTVAYASGCGGCPEEWALRWEEARALLQSQNGRASD